MTYKITTYFLLATLTLSLSSCATTHRLGDGVIVAAKPLNERDYSPNSGAIPLITSVRILEKNGTIFVRKN